MISYCSELFVKKINLLNGTVKAKKSIFVSNSVPRWFIVGKFVLRSQIQMCYKFILQSSVSIIINNISEITTKSPRVIVEQIE